MLPCPSRWCFLYALTSVVVICHFLDCFHKKGLAHSHAPRAWLAPAPRVIHPCLVKSESLPKIRTSTHHTVIIFGVFKFDPTFSHSKSAPRICAPETQSHACHEAPVMNENSSKTSSVPFLYANISSSCSVVLPHHSQTVLFLPLW